MQLGHIDVGDLVQPAVVDQTGGLVDVLGVDLQFLGEEAQDALVGAAGDLEAHHAREATLAQLPLDGLQQIVGILLIGLDLGVARHAERQHLQDLHAREELVQVVLDEFLQRRVAARAGHLIQARRDLGHLHAREQLLAFARSAQHHAQAHAHVADEREAVARIHGQRREDGEHVAMEPGARLGALGVRKLFPGEQLDAAFLHGGQQVAAQHIGLHAAHVLHALADRLHLLPGRERIRHGAGRAVLDLLAQRAHALHEELVEVVREDRQEAHALEQRHRVIGGHVEHATVELEPLEITVQEARWIAARAGRGGACVGGGGFAMRAVATHARTCMSGR